jgi:hypothetical protein
MTKKSAHRAKAQIAPPAIVLFGLDQASKPHAACFREADIEVALKAAASIGLNVLKVASPEQAKIASALPAGRIHATGRGLVAPIRQDLYGKLTELARAEGMQLRGLAQPATGSLPPNPPASPPRRGTPTLPRSWDELDVGHLVIAPEDDRKQDGWWQAIIVGKSGDMFTLRWQRWPRQKKILRHRFNLGLIYPGPDPSAPVSASSSPQYPSTWDGIAADSLVLAKEDGPMEAWWDATVVEANGDALGLRWRDFPNLPVINRDRLNLGLLYPNPQ